MTDAKKALTLIQCKGEYHAFGQGYRLNQEEHDLVLAALQRAAECEKQIGHIDDALSCAHAEIRVLKDKAQEKPVELAVADISRYIQTWRFDDDIDGAFGAYLMKLHPQGIKIIEGGE